MPKLFADSYCRVFQIIFTSHFCINSNDVSGLGQIIVSERNYQHYHSINQFPVSLIVAKKIYIIATRLGDRCEMLETVPQTLQMDFTYSCFSIRIERRQDIKVFL